MPFTFMACFKLMAINEALPSLDNGFSRNSQTSNRSVKKRNNLDNSLLHYITLCSSGKMSANRVINDLVYKTILHGGKKLEVAFAIKTTAWDRKPELLAPAVKDDFSKAIEKADVPAGAAKVTLA
jgi:hypothetical protein